jgi:hypothetical protein
MKSFADLFKKYRLRAEFGTLSEFGAALAEKGFICEDSIFSHWQKGTRVPSTREMMLKIIEIFIERKALLSLQETNDLLESAHYGYLTSKEIEELDLTDNIYAPFQVPSEIDNFTGREVIVEKVKKQLTAGNILLLHGPPGVGKTAIAIKMGHLLRDKFPDGVLWYKVDSSNIMDILLSIARLFGEDISGIKDVEVRASIVRTLLCKKRILLIFDNVIVNESIHLLIPNSPTSSVIFSSQENALTIPTKYLSVYVDTFTEKEAIALFETIFSKAFVKKNTKQIIEICEKLGYLPLALQMVANYIKQYPMSFKDYMKQLDEEPIDLQQMAYEDKNLFRAVSISYDTLSNEAKKVFISLGVFEGKDFSLEAVAYINKLSGKIAKGCLDKLRDISFVEESSNKRFRVHPLIKIYARKQLTDTNLYLRTAQYYEQLLAKTDDKNSFKNLRLEVDNIIYIFKQCYENGYWNEVITLWNPIEKLLFDANEIKKLKSLTETIDTSPKINKLQKMLSIFMFILFLYWIFLYTSGLKASGWNYLYSLLYSIFPLTGGIVGIFRSGSWGLFKSNIGKAIFFISVGLFSWGIGNTIWGYYNFFQNTNAPYPSLADLFYFPSYFFWVTGILYLSWATGAKFVFKKTRSKIILLLIPFIVILLSSYLLFFVIKRTFASETPLRIFFDLAYPTGDIIILTIATIIFGLSANFFGGKYKLSVYAILLGFVFEYIGDTIFSYANSVGNYYNGGLADLMFSLGLYIMAWGTLSFYFIPKKKK